MQCPVHLAKCGIVVMQTAILHHAPELQTIHHKRVVRTFLISQTCVEVVDLPQLRHVTHDDIDHL